MIKYIILLSLLTTISFSKEFMKVEIENYSFQAPKLWMVQYTNQPQKFFVFSPVETNDTFQENMNLTIEDLPQKYTVKEYLKAAVAGLKSVMTNFKVLKQKDNYHIFTGNLNNLSLKQIQYVYIKNKTAYILTGSATPQTFDRYKKYFDDIAKSFKVK